MNIASNQQATSLQMFYNEDANVSIRTEVISNEPWFVAKDVCNALGIEHHRDALTRIDEDERGSLLLDTLGGKQTIGAVNESGLYHLIFQSRKPEARAFRKWVTNEVLPSIRRTGTYSSNGVQTSVEEPSKKLPLPKFRPYFAEWKEKVKFYLSVDEAIMIATKLGVSYSHVRKVYAGTAVSERVTRALNAAARYNYDRGIVYPEARPVYEQLSLEWEEQE